MKNCYRFLVIIYFYIISSAYGAGYGAMSDDLLPLTISNLGPTRLSMDNQKIQDAFFYPEKAARLIIHKSGSVFIIPNKDYKKIYLTLIGKRGGTQDLRLTFVKKEPQPIKIYFKEPANYNKLQAPNKQENIKGDKK